MKLFSKKTLALLLALAMVASLFSGCGGQADDEAGKPTGAVADANEGEGGSVSVSTGTAKTVVVAANEIGTPEVYSKKAGGAMYWSTSVYESLGFRVNLGGDAVPIMMKSYEQIDDVTYEIEIYDYIYDSQGNHITASDVEYAYTYAKELGTSISSKYEYCKAISDYKVELVLTSNSVGYFDECLMQAVVSRKAFEDNPDHFASGGSCGTGPYQVKEYVQGSKIVLEKRDNYWQTDESLIPDFLKANVDSYTVMAIKEPTQLAIALESGTIDMAMSLTGSNVDYFVDADGNAKDGYAVATNLSSMFNAMLLNMDSSNIFLDNPKLREAILYATDREGILQGVIGGKGEPGYTFGCRTYGDFQEKWMEESYYDYDLEKARQLLEESGFKQTKPIRIMFQTNADWQKEAEILSYSLNEIGLETEILQYDVTLFKTYQYDPSQWDIMLGSWRASDFVVNAWAFMFFYDGYLVGGLNHLVDDTLIQMIKDTSTPEGHTPENLDAVHQYIKDLAIGMSTYCNYTYHIAREGIDIYTCTTKTIPFVWASTFADDFVSAGE